MASQTRDLLHEARRSARVALFAKSAAGIRSGGIARPQPKLAVNPAKKPASAAKTPASAGAGKPPAMPTTAPAIPAPGDYVQVQRPGMHPAPVWTRMLAAGNHGVTVQDDHGRELRVRHEHVLNYAPAPMPQERAQLANALHAQGIPMSLDERFLKLDATGQPQRRATTSQLTLLDVLATHGAPIDLEQVTANASYDDAQALLTRYTQDPTGQIVPAQTSPIIRSTLDF